MHDSHMARFHDLFRGSQYLYQLSYGEECGFQENIPKTLAVRENQEYTSIRRMECMWTRHAFVTESKYCCGNGNFGVHP